MSKILGLDLGQNSIGWAIVDDGKISEMGTKIFPNERVLCGLAVEKKHTVIKTFKSLSFRQKLTLVLFSILTILTFVNISNWQFWLGLNVTTLLTYLTMEK
ncbi:hypothetical protein [Flavobacterium sp.]|uniref:hypothetical protein n=1 Tax=Flavobacterium sp. TaxID=239 RepID=UPI002FDA840E